MLRGQGKRSNIVRLLSAYTILHVLLACTAATYPSPLRACFDFKHPLAVPKGCTEHISLFACESAMMLVAAIGNALHMFLDQADVAPSPEDSSPPRLTCRLSCSFHALCVICGIYMRELRARQLRCGHHGTQV